MNGHHLLTTDLFPGTESLHNIPNNEQRFGDCKWCPLFRGFAVRLININKIYPFRLYRECIILFGSVVAHKFYPYPCQNYPLRQTAYECEPGPEESVINTLEYL